MAISGIVDTVARRLNQANLSELEDQVRRYVLRHFAETGQPPQFVELQRQFHLLSTERVQAILARLHAADLIVYDEALGRAAAYPFSSQPTGHRAEMDGRTLHALCAIDALGIPFMLDAPAWIRSECFWCHAPIEVYVEHGELSNHRPDGLVVWYPEKDSCSCVATSRCILINFFCSTDHLTVWRGANPDEHGTVLSLEEALEAGQMIFGKLLLSEASEVR